jgi:hypothetical protein
MTWRPQSQNSRNINNVENPQLDQNSRPNARGGFAPRGRGRGRGRGPPRLTNHNPRDPYFYCSIMEEDIAPKGAQKPRRTSQEFNKRKL